MKPSTGLKILIPAFLVAFAAAEFSFADQNPPENTEIQNHLALLAKPIGFNLQSGLVGCCAALTPGLALEWKLTPNSALVLEFERQIYNTTYGDAGKRHLNGSTWSAQYKHLLGKTLYLKGGLSKKLIEYSYLTATEDSSFEGRSLAMTVAVGSQWTLSSAFMFGIDWIGSTFPLQTSFESESVRGGNQSEARDRLNKVEDATLRERAWFGLNLYFGMAF